MVLHTTHLWDLDEPSRDQHYAVSPIFNRAQSPSSFAARPFNIVTTTTMSILLVEDTPSKQTLGWGSWSSLLIVDPNCDVQRPTHSARVHYSHVDWSIALCRWPSTASFFRDPLGPPMAGIWIPILAQEEPWKRPEPDWLQNVEAAPGGNR
jgi:hypothetical protein